MYCSREYQPSSRLIQLYEKSTSNRTFKLIKGRNSPTTFLPLSPKIGGQVKNNRSNVGQYLTREQTNYVYKRTELGELIHTETLQQELGHKR